MAAFHTGPVTEFADATEPWRKELMGMAYRMLGSWDEAEDAVQETYLRAWRAWDGFEHRSSPRTWLHRIATNTCLSALDGRRRRALPSGLGATTADSPETLAPEAWIQPYAEHRDDLRLALVAGLQTLPPRQRAVLVLRDAFGFTAAEVAEMLNSTVAAVKSSLQRARGRLAQLETRPEDVVEPTSPTARRLLDAYVAAFERAEVELLTDVLRSDATLEVLPGTHWYDGRAACISVLNDAVSDPGDWRMMPTVANGQPAVTAYFRGAPYGAAVLDVRTGGIAAITVFGDPALVKRLERIGSVQG